jgi:hypothetical protein
MRLRPGHPRHVDVRDQAGGAAQMTGGQKAAADGKASVVNPNDFMRPFVASRTDSSSSTSEIRGFFGTPTSGIGFKTSAAQRSDANAPGEDLGGLRIHRIKRPVRRLYSSIDGLRPSGVRFARESLGGSLCRGTFLTQRTDPVDSLEAQDRLTLGFWRARRTWPTSAPVREGLLR